MATIRAIVVVTVVFLYIFLTAPPMLIYSVLARETDSIYAVGRFGAKIAVWFAGIKLDVRHREKIPVGQAALFLANHQSNCDPPALVSILPPIWIMAKKEFFRIPFLNIGMRMRGFISIDRSNRAAAIRSVDRAAESLKSGRPFIAYPEGTRSPDGRIQNFKRGVFVMAIKAGAPIVPISVSGGHKIMTKGKWAIHPGTLRITFHDPVPTAGLVHEDRNRLSRQVREIIISGLTEQERPKESAGSRTA